MGIEDWKIQPTRLSGPFMHAVGNKATAENQHLTIRDLHTLSSQVPRYIFDTYGTSQNFAYSRIDSIRAVSTKPDGSSDGVQPCSWRTPGS